MEAEKIGNVTLNLAHYGGEDLYSDGAVEDDLLAIVQAYPREDYPRILRERASWPVLYHLSQLRENIVDWIRIPEGAKVLEIGAGCGALTGVLSRKAGRVDCVELSRKRSRINAYRHRDRENITIHVGNFEDIEPTLDTDYAYIFLIGVYEYAASYIRQGADAYRGFLEIISRHRGPEGTIVIAIENRLGLKYFAGAREDHLGSYFSGIEGYAANSNVRTFPRPALERIFADCGYTSPQFYYPYPDYKFMTTLYSDRRLPREGELTTNLLNLDRERMSLFDERRAYEALLLEGLYPLFANSYLVLLGGASEVAYCKYANDRADDYAIRTELVEEQGASGSQWQIEKHPLREGARAHLAAMRRSEGLLRRRYAGSDLEVCPCEATADGGAAFPCLTGDTLERLLDDALRAGDAGKIRGLLERYRGYVGYGEELGPTDMDLIFSNLLIDAQKERWQLIDYEWVEEGAVPAGAVAERALYEYLSGDASRRADMALVRTMAEALQLAACADEAWLEEFLARGRQREAAFQARILGGRAALGEMNARIGNPIWMLTGEMGAREAREAQKERMQAQVYYDRGAGFREEDSEFLVVREDAGPAQMMGEDPAQPLEDGSPAQMMVGEASAASLEDAGPAQPGIEAGIHRQEDESLLLEVTVSPGQGVRALRFDPARTSCLLSIQEITMDAQPIRRYQTNGRRIGRCSDVWVFAGEDPNVTIPIKGTGRLRLRYLIQELDRQLATASVQA